MGANDKVAATFHPAVRPECTTCGSEYTSPLAAALCCDTDERYERSLN